MQNGIEGYTLNSWVDADMDDVWILGIHDNSTGKVVAESMGNDDHHKMVDRLWDRVAIMIEEGIL